MKSLIKKVESALEIYRYLPPDNGYKRRIDKALKELEDHPYFEVLKMRYQDKLTLEQIAEHFNCNYQTIAKHKDKLLEIVAKIVFPEEYLMLIMDEEAER